MNLSNWINLLAVIVAVIAAIIAFSAKRSERAANDRANELAEKNNRLVDRNNELSAQANAIQAQLVTIESERDDRQQRALRQARYHIICSTLANGHTVLNVKNVGTGTANQLHVTLDRANIETHQALISSNLAESKYTVSPWTDISFELNLKDWIPKPTSLHFAWVDEMSLPRSESFELDALGCFRSFST